MSRDADHHLLALIEQAWAIALSDPPRARQINDSVLDRLDARTEPRIRGLALRNQAYLDHFGSNIGRALEDGVMAVSLLEGADAHLDASTAHATLARTYAQVEAMDRALEHAIKAFDLALKGGSEGDIAAAKVEVAFMYLENGDYEQASRTATDALALSEACGFDTGQVRCHRTLGLIHQSRGHLELALEHFTRTIALTDRTGITYGKCQSRHGLADVLIQAGRLHEARSRLEEACLLGEALDDETPLFRSRLRLARVMLLLDEHDRARDMFQEILARCGTSRHLEFAIEAHKGLAETSEKRGDTATALQHLRDSSALEVQIRKQEALERMRHVEWVIQATSVQRELELSSRILEDTLPASIVAEIKQHGHARPILHPDATVLFTDLVGFTKVAEHLGPEDLVASLDALFGAFDAISSRRGIEKIKTIGDAYMACAGVPEYRPNHPAIAVLAALEMREVVRDLARETPAGRPAWGIRIGLHTGSVLAGVIGKTKLAYDIWGDAVNTASRMESSGVPDHINVSEAVASRIEPYFVVERRGKVQAKNKGELEMAFVHRLRPEWSADDGGSSPSMELLEKLGLVPEPQVNPPAP